MIYIDLEITTQSRPSSDYTIRSTMSKNAFLLEPDQYRRSLDPIGDWVRQSALYASRMLGKPYEQCLAHLRKKLKTKEIKPFNPTVVYYQREENGDKYKKTIPLYGYIQDVLQNKEILAPTFTTYLHPSVKSSLIVDFMDDNVRLRTKFKKMSQAYEANNEVGLAKYYNQAQDGAKRDNNACSGGFVAEGVIISNKSAHSTLTSMTRSMSSLSNASNERLIEGNRHYHTPDIALNNLISVVKETDSDTIRQAVSHYNLTYPTVDDVMQCIHRSTEPYWSDRRHSRDIQDFVEKLSPEERASVVYTGDLYHLRILNNTFIRGLLTDLARRGSDVDMDDPVSVIRTTDEAIVNFAHQSCISIVEGIGKDYSKISKDKQCIVANTCKSIEQAVEKYRLLFKAFFLTKNSPATIATIPFMTRRSVVLSDTDSTMFSVDNWVLWYFNKMEFSDEEYAIGGAVSYIATQAIAHLLAIFSANMNVEKKRLFTLAMKPEYVFPVFAQTSVAKHYYTCMKVKEGNVYKAPKFEVKGVHLKDSSVPVNLIEAGSKTMQSILDDVIKAKPISLLEKLKEVADIEREIIDSLYRGEVKYLKRIRIKEASSYSQDAEHSNYAYYTLWERCFAPTYGSVSKPPYGAVRIPLDLDKRSKLQGWVEQISTNQTGRLLVEWIKEKEVHTLSSIAIPIDHCVSKGVPEELKVAMDVRRIVLALTKAQRNVLESLGYFPKKDRMISDLGY